MRKYRGLFYLAASLLLIVTLVPNCGYSDSMKGKPPRLHTQSEEKTSERNTKKEENADERNAKKDNAAAPERKARRERSELPRKENNPSYNFTVESAQRPWSHSGSVWNKEYLNSPEGERSRRDLEAFEQHKLGASVRDFDLTGMTAQEIKEKAIDKGFDHRSEPLKDGEGQFIKKGPKGQNTTRDPNDPDIVRQEIYEHKDKGLIRVKPEGSPGSRFRPEPAVSKSVLYADAKDSSFGEEAFKVSNRDLPVPKWPDRRASDIADGLKSGSDEKILSRLDAIADLGHTNLPEVQR